jgi:hypothetical protein
MATHMPGRTISITGEILATDDPQSIILYSPSTAIVLGTPVNYNGDMARIRIFSIINSLPEVFTPVILPTDTEAQKEQKNSFFTAQPKKGLIVSLEDPLGKRFHAGIVNLYNVRPNFVSGVNEFFSDLDIYGIQFGYKIVAQVVDRGYGLLRENLEENQQNDCIHFTGFARESSSFLQGSDDAIYNYII